MAKLFSDLQSVNSGGEVKIVNELVQAKDIVAALTQAKTKHVPDNMYLMHYTWVSPSMGEQMVDDAIGMQANDLMVLYHFDDDASPWSPKSAAVAARM